MKIDTKVVAIAIADSAQKLLDHIKELETERDILICNHLERVWGEDSPFTQDAFKQIIYGRFPTPEHHREWKALNQKPINPPDIDSKVSMIKE